MRAKLYRDAPRQVEWHKKTNIVDMAYEEIMQWRVMAKEAAEAVSGICMHTCVLVTNVAIVEASPDYTMHAASATTRK